ncbi:hypothetical protein ACS3QZ_05390 [Shimia sp. W99]
MNTALLIIGIVILLVVVAAGIEAYVRGQTKRPLAQSRPTRVMHRAPGQLATDTSLLQDILEDSPRRKQGSALKERSGS